MIKNSILCLLGTIKRIPLFLSMLSVRTKNLYIFGSWFGEKYSDNSRALYEYALKYTSKKCVWITRNKDVYRNLSYKRYPVAMSNSLKGIFYQLRAGVAFSSTGDGDFCRLLLGNCIHIELWHGVGGGKTIGLDDREYKRQMDTPKGRYYRKLERYPLRKRYFVCTSETMKTVFKSAFLIPDDHFIMAGQPRNDMFFEKGYKFRTVEPEKYNGKTIILYMPTHRKSGKERINCEKLFDLQRLEEFCERYNCLFLIKKHFYHNKEIENLSCYPSIIDITNEKIEANELLMIADYLVSDYSSVTADYLLLNRPIFYYCYDYKEYIKEDREMYWSFDEISPGSKSRDFEQLLCNLKLTIVDGNDQYASDRQRVRTMFYTDTGLQCVSGLILEEIEKLC